MLAFVLVYRDGDYVSVHYNGVFFPDIILLILYIYHWVVIRLNLMKSFLSPLQPTFPRKRFDNFRSDWVVGFQKV